MTNMIWTTLQEYTNEIKEVYGCHLKNVILFGQWLDDNAYSKKWKSF